MDDDEKFIQPEQKETYSDSEEDIDEANPDLGDKNEKQISENQDGQQVGVGNKVESWKKSDNDKLLSDGKQLSKQLVNYLSLKEKLGISTINDENVLPFLDATELLCIGLVKSRAGFGLLYRLLNKIKSFRPLNAKDIPLWSHPENGINATLDKITTTALELSKKSDKFQANYILIRDSFQYFVTATAYHEQPFDVAAEHIRNDIEKLKEFAVDFEKLSGNLSTIVKASSHHITNNATGSNNYNSHLQKLNKLKIQLKEEDAAIKKFVMENEPALLDQERKVSKLIGETTKYELIIAMTEGKKKDKETALKQVTEKTQRWRDEVATASDSRRELRSRTWYRSSWWWWSWRSHETEYYYDNVYTGDKSRKQESLNMYASVEKEIEQSVEKQADLIVQTKQNLIETQKNIETEQQQLKKKKMTLTNN